MRYFKIVFLSFIFSLNSFKANSQVVTIPDPNFLAALISEGVDLNNDGIIQVSEAIQIDSLYISSKNIYSLVGIEEFSNLEKLNCSNNVIDSLDLRNNIKLTHLDCHFCYMKSLNITGITSFVEVKCNANIFLTSLNLSGNTQLNFVDCSENSINSLNLNGCNFLKKLYCWANKILLLDLNQKSSLEEVYCQNNLLDSINLLQNSSLKTLNCFYNNLSSLYINHSVMLNELNCGNNNISLLNVYNNSVLHKLLCDNNSLNFLDVSQSNTGVLSCIGNPNLSVICVSNVQLFMAFDPYYHQFWNKDPTATFSSTCLTSIQELNVNEQKNRKIVRIYNLLGQEIMLSDNNNEGVMIIQFSDGSVKKVINGLD